MCFGILVVFVRIMREDGSYAVEEIMSYFHTICYFRSCDERSIWNQSIWSVITAFCSNFKRFCAEQEEKSMNFDLLSNLFFFLQILSGESYITCFWCPRWACQGQSLIISLYLWKISTPLDERSSESYIHDYSRYSWGEMLASSICVDKIFNV